MKRPNCFLLLFLTILIGLLLAGCGGGGDEAPAVEEQTPELNVGIEIKTGKGNEKLAKKIGEPGRKNPLPLVAFSGNRILSHLKEDPETGKYFRVEDFGAVPNDGSDDTKAFQDTLAHAKKWVADHRSPATVVVGEGVFDLSDVLFVEGGGIYISGSGRNKTELCFHKHLGEAFRLKGSPFLQKFSWKYGFVWFCPDTTRDLRKDFTKYILQDVNVKEGSVFLPGEFSSLSLKEGDVVRLILRGGEELLREISGDPGFSMEDHPEWTILDEEGHWWYHNLNVVDHVSEKGITLVKPLRLGLNKRRALYVMKSGSELAVGGGISDLSIRFKVEDKQKYRHLKEKGYNALFLQKTAGIEVARVNIEDADNALVLEYSHHNVIEDVLAKGERKSHHGVSMRNSHDNTVIEWVQTQPVQHGLGVQDFSSGNVFSNCRLDNGTLDCHRGMPFDTVRTEIVFSKASGHGGGAYGPQAGRRIVSWNVHFMQRNDMNKHSRKSVELITNPTIYPQGAIVGVYGVKPYDKAASGKKADIVDWGKRPSIPNLFEYQVNNFGDVK